MRLAQKISINNNIGINQAIYQSLNILQFSELELQKYLDTQIEQNPFIEIEKNIEENNYDDNVHNNVEISQNNLEGFSEDIFNTYSKNKFNDYNNELEIEGRVTLTQIITHQINCNFKNITERKIALLIFDYLEPTGYLNINLDEFCDKIGISKKNFEKILKILQNFEPVGIFARNLRENIEIQLKHRKIFDNIYQVITNNLEMLGNCEFQKLAKLAKISEKQIGERLKIIKSLDPKPGLIHHFEYINNIIPEAIIYKNKEGKLCVELPRYFDVKLNKNYYDNIRLGNISSNEDDKLKSYFASASLICKSINHRKNSILNLARAIAEIQEDFFIYGINYLKPLNFMQVSEKLGLHESTISRIVSNKYIYTPKGMLPFKFFFSNGINNEKDNEKISSISIQNIIKNIIEKEEINNILSDDKISEILAEQNFTVARRTVTKYREIMGIASSQVRKRFKRITKGE